MLGDGLTYNFYLERAQPLPAARGQHGALDTKVTNG